MIANIGKCDTGPQTAQG